MHTQCPHGHLIQTSRDRLPNGYCRACQRDQNQRYRRKRRMALDVVRALEEHGLMVLDDDAPVSEIVAGLIESRRTDA